MHHTMKHLGYNADFEKVVYDLTYGASVVIDEEALVFDEIFIWSSHAIPAEEQDDRYVTGSYDRRWWH